MSIASIIALILIFVVGIPSFKIIKETLDRARLLEDQLLAINSQLRDMEFKLEELDEKMSSPSASSAKHTLHEQEEIFQH